MYAAVPEHPRLSSARWNSSKAIEVHRRARRRRSIRFSDLCVFGPPAGWKVSEDAEAWTLSRSIAFYLPERVELEPVGKEAF